MDNYPNALYRYSISEQGYIGYSIVLMASLVTVAKQKKWVWEARNDTEQIGLSVVFQYP